jgi:hypothetical protein
MPHHGVSVAPGVCTSITISFALIAFTHDGATKLPTRVLMPLFEAQALTLFSDAGRPPQSSQPRFKPPGPA